MFGTFKPFDVMMSCLASFFVCTLVILVSKHLHLRSKVDYRRDESVPIMGGLGLYSGLFVAYLFGDLKLGELLLSAFPLLIVGVIDDVFELRVRFKLAGQILSAVLLCAVLRVELPIAAFYIFWTLTLVNAYNFIDGLDGLAISVATTQAAVMYFLAPNGQAVSLAPIIGAGIGFLVWNFPPARLYLGETGSSFLGFMMASLSLSQMNPQPTGLWVGSLFLAFAYPLIDVLLAVTRRVSRDLSPFLADKDHLHHKLSRLRMSKRMILGSIVVTSTFCSVVGWTVLKDQSIVLFLSSISLLLVYMASILIAERHLGHVSARSMLMSRVRMAPALIPLDQRALVVRFEHLFREIQMRSIDDQQRFVEDLLHLLATDLNASTLWYSDHNSVGLVPYDLERTPEKESEILRKFENLLSHHRVLMSGRLAHEISFRSYERWRYMIEDTRALKVVSTRTGQVRESTKKAA